MITKENAETVLDNLDLPQLGGEQKECVLGLIAQIRSDVLLISTRRFEVGVAMSKLFDIAGHGSFEQLRKKFFPEVPKRSAQRYTAVGREFGLYKEEVMGIGFSYLGKLAEQGVLIQIKSELIEQIKRGEKADGHYYRKRITELLREEAELENIANDAVGNDNIRSEESQTDSDEKESGKKIRIDDQSMIIVEDCIPSDPKQLQALWNILNIVRGKRVVTEYLYKRVGELIRNKKMQPSDEAEEAEHDSLEPA